GVSGGQSSRQLTSRGKGYGYGLYWSPDSSKLSFIDETNTIYLVDVESGEVAEVASSVWNLGHGSRYGYNISWSPDSRWLTFALGQQNTHTAIYIYDAEESELQQVTSGFYSDLSPIFSADGQYLFFLTNRNFDVVYSDLDQTWVYPNATQLAAISLDPSTPSLLPVKNDEVEFAADEDEAETNDAASEDAAVNIMFAGMEARIELLPPAAGNIGALMPFDGKVAYVRRPNTGSAEEDANLVFYDIEGQEEKTILADVDSVVATADYSGLLVESNNRFGIVSAEPEQRLENAIATDGLVMQLVPREEWQQIYDDTWRRYRDFFYDPEMHGLDWDALREQYAALLPDARTRWDVQRIQFHLLGETSAGHTYVRQGDVETVERRMTGYLGIDWEQEGNLYRVARIVQPAAWDTEVRSPFDATGIEVGVGDYILEVNGMPLRSDLDPYAPFEGLSGKTVSLLVSATGEREDAEAIIVKTLTQSQENLLRNLEWIESNRRMVEELSDGRLGYVYMTNTADRGQLELVRMFYGQLDKEGFVIDERFNGGGQLADRFLELMQRPVVYNLHWRHGQDQTQPPQPGSNVLGMLINGWAASGGDGLPWAFQELEAGPIVGENTMGILVGPATGHNLIDGGGITVPGARLYDNDGHWFWEGEGVSPDLEVWDDPSILASSRDPQLERLVSELMEMLESAPPRMTPAPPLEDRTARGLQ
ncbi:MAG TPA: Tricorn protease like protein, partial [Gammaproteobacteria bacterium]|nr:Tricorn protease like protein [Gammaproteobacteria bacterium]